MSDSAQGAPAVVVEGASKRFRIPHERVNTLKERALHPFKRRRFDELKALQDVSFAVEQGEFFGIMGRNGSGKSTLLKCLAGIYRLDGGNIWVEGRLSTFIELGVGFDPELPAGDNILLNGIMLGLSPSEARKRIDGVIEFAELEEFSELKLKNYSSGMQVRLAFSVMIQVDPDILLIDEVLAVGDAAFQQKCFDEFHRLRAAGKTILFVTHDMAAVRRFCDRALLIDRGEVKLIDEPGRVSDSYMELNFGRDLHEREGPDERYGDGAAQIREVWFEDASEQRVTRLAQGEPCTIRMRMAFHQALRNPIVAFLLENERMQPLFATSNEDGGQETGEHEAGDETVFSVRFENHFAPGRLYVTPWMLHDGGTRIIDRRVRVASAIVTSPHQSGGIVDLPNDMTYERVPSHLRGPVSA